MIIYHLCERSAVILRGKKTSLLKHFLLIHMAAMMVYFLILTIVVATMNQEINSGVEGQKKLPQKSKKIFLLLIKSDLRICLFHFASSSQPPLNPALRSPVIM
jgi:hypothetical protein